MTYWNTSEPKFVKKPASSFLVPLVVGWIYGVSVIDHFGMIAKQGHDLVTILQAKGDQHTLNGAPTICEGQQTKDLSGLWKLQRPTDDLKVPATVMVGAVVTG